MYVFNLTTTDLVKAMRIHAKRSNEGLAPRANDREIRMLFTELDNRLTRGDELPIDWKARRTEGSFNEN